MKKLVVCAIAAAICLVMPVKAVEVSARGAILMDGDTGQVLYEKNADEKSLIASTTKIMTALVSLEQGNLAEVVEIPAAAVGIEGSSMYLKTGEELTVEQLLYGMMLSSGNDAAMALALHIGGSVEGFAEKMNEKARELGLQNAHFANPNGLDSEENYATARDLGKLAAAAMQNEEFRKVVSTKSCQFDGHYLTNHNKLLWQYQGAVGVKTGFTKHAGRILVGAAEREGRRLISVTINAPNDWQDHKAMLDYGFSQYTRQPLLYEGQALGAIPVISGEKSEVMALAGGNLSAFSLPGEQPEVRLYPVEFVYGPVSAGQTLGTAEVYLAGRKIGTVPLLAAEEIAQSPYEEPGFFQGLKDRLFA